MISPFLKVLLPSFNSPHTFDSAKGFILYDSCPFKILNSKLEFRILELAVAIRSYYLQRPYGDQGLLIHKDLYNLSGGYSSLKIMEDLDLIIRITKNNKVMRIGENIYTDDIKWTKTNIIKRAVKNARLRNKWRQGYNIDTLSKEYYS